jgi:ankyrin repeat protein
LSRAARCGSTTVLAFLLAQKDVDVESEDSKGWTALHIANKNGHCTAVELILSHLSVNPTHTDGDGKTAFIWAASCGHEEIVDTFISREDWGMEKIDIKDKRGRTALFWAARAGHACSVTALLRAGSNPNSEDIYGHTALLVAIERDHYDIAMLLLEKDAGIGSKGRAILEAAAFRGNWEAAEVLHAKGISSNNFWGGYVLVYLRPAKLLS